MSFAIKQDVLCEVGGGFVQSFVDVNESQPCVKIIETLPLFLLFCVLLLTGATFGFISLSTVGYIVFVAYAAMAFLQKSNESAKEN